MSPQCVPKLTETTPKPSLRRSSFQTCTSSGSTLPAVHSGHPLLRTGPARCVSTVPASPVAQSSTSWLSSHPSKTSGNLHLPGGLSWHPGNCDLHLCYRSLHLPHKLQPRCLRVRARPPGTPKSAQVITAQTCPLRWHVQGRQTTPTRAASFIHSLMWAAPQQA